MPKEEFDKIVQKYNGDAFTALRQVIMEYNNGIRKDIDDWECHFASHAITRE